MKFGAVLIFLVIPGRAEGANPESRHKLSACIWIPGPLAEFIIGPRVARTRWRAARNDKGGVP